MASAAKMRCFLLMLSLFVAVDTRFINFEAGFEYRYKFSSNADVRNLGKFETKAKVGYTNVNETADGQEVYVRIYTLMIGPHDQMSVPGEEWDLSKWFSFMIAPHGEISHVYHPPGEDDEIVAVKKGLAGVFASQLHHDESWMKKTEDGLKYHVQELGHEGFHNSTYVVKTNDQGKVFTKVRHGHPVKHAEGNYTKTLHFDNELGNIHTVVINETFRALHYPNPDFDPYENTRPMKPKNQFSKVKIPEMSALANGKLVFMTRFKTNEIPQRPEAELQKSSIELDEVKWRRMKKVDVNKVQKFISGNLTCMRAEPEEGTSKMSTCFRNIVTNLQDLPDEAVTKLADRFIRFNVYATKSFSRDRKHMLDAIAFLDTDLSQMILLDKVLGHPHPDPFLFKRYLVHIVAKDIPPLPEIVSKLEDLVFKRDAFPRELHGDDSYHNTLLTLGAVGRKLHLNGMEDQALRIITKLHNWLGIHDPWKYRNKRATMSEVDMLKEDEWNVVLLETLGNAGLDQSFVYIESHVNSTNSNWVKRAGIHAMRWYYHEKARDIILKTALYDDNDKVRYEAMLQFRAHPLAAAVAPFRGEMGSNNGSIFYAEPGDSGIYDIDIHDRRKRGILDDINFVLQSPSINWAKVLGSKKVGASLEVIVNNLLKLYIKPLSGKIVLDIHDEARAIVHLGIVGVNIDFFIARLCFKGHAGYNLNILKDYGVDDIQKLVELYDDIKGQSSSAVSSAIKIFNSILNADITIGAIMDDFIKALEEMPEKVLRMNAKALNASRVMGEMDQELLPPFMKPTFNLVMTVSNLLNDIKSDVLGFYSTLRETVTVIMPQSVMQITESIDKIISGFDNFNNDPMAAITSLAGNVMTVGSSVKNLVDAINTTKNACFFLKGNRPYWWDLKGEFTKIKAMAIKAKHAIEKDGPKWVSSAAKLTEDGTDMIAKLTKGKFTTADMYASVMATGKEVMEDILKPFDVLYGLGGKFLKTYQTFEKLVSSVKKAYNDLKEGYRTARSLIDKVFGPKCHKNFPRTVRLQDSECSGGGAFVSTLGKAGTKEYDSEGMDLVISAGSMIVAPFGGNLYRSSNENEVIIEPTGGSLKKTKIIISNIEPNDTVSYSQRDPDLVRAGEQIGVAIRTPCDNHIHFALKRGKGYIDPKNYLRPRVPELPKWIQECDDYKLVFKGNTIGEGTLIGIDGEKDEDTSPPRDGETVTNPPNIPESKKPSEQLSAAQNEPDSMYQKQKTKKTEIATKTESTKDSALATLFKKPLSFMKSFKVSDIKVGSIIDMLDIMNLPESKQKLAEVIRNIKEMIDSKPCFNPHQMTDDELRSELTERGMNAEGTRKAMIARLSKPPNKCPGISLSLPKNVFCTIDSHCLGIECCAFFKLGIFRKTFKLYARLDPCDFQFVLGVEKKFEKVFGASDGMKDLYTGFENVLKTGVKLDMFNSVLELIIKLKFEKDDKGAYITLGTGFCQQDDNSNCMGFFNLLDMMPLMLPICLEDGTMKWPEIDYKKMFSREAIKKRLRENLLKAGKELAKSALNELLKQLPCISPDAPGKSSTCPRPDAMTPDLLKSELAERSLPTDGTSAVLKQRLYEATQTCTISGKTLTLPQIKNENIKKFVHLSIDEKCLRVDACVDVKIEKLGFFKAFKAFIELDACKFTLVISFMDCTEELIFFKFPWGQAKEFSLSNNIAIKYNIDRNLETKMFIIDFGLKFGIEGFAFDTYLVEGLEMPMPLCNDNFQLPGTGLIMDLAKSMGSKLANDVVNVIFKQLGLDKIFLDGQCTLNHPTTDCPWDVTKVTQYIPEKFKDKVKCELPENCFGLQCCIDFAFKIPVFENIIEKNTPFFFKFDPCEFLLEIGFGGFSHKEKLISYDYGTSMTFTAGNGEPKPITIVLIIDKYDKGFLISLHLTVCIPIDGTPFCVPEEGLQLLDKEKFPACDANALVDLVNQSSSVSEWAKKKGIDLAKGLARSAVDMLLLETGVSKFLKTERCDVTREPYSPSVDGWRNECELPTRKLSKLPAGMFCHIAKSCSKIDCCFIVPFLADMSFNAVLNVDMCDYFVYAALEKVEFKKNILGSQIDWNAGLKHSIEIANMFFADFTIRKADKKFIMDLNVRVCYGDKCQLEKPILTDTEIPQLFCDLNAQLGGWKDFSLKDWALKRGQDLTKGLKEEAVNFLLQQIGLSDKLLKPGCDRTDLKYNPANLKNWKNECKYSSLVKLPDLSKLPVNCHINDKCLGIDCCMSLDFLNGLSINSYFNIDLCNFLIEGDIETFRFKINILDYEWGKQSEITMDNLPFLKIKFKIDRLLSLEVFLIDLSMHICFGGDKCEVDLVIFNKSQVPMPGCNMEQGFKVPNFNLKQWLKDKGGEMSALLSAKLMEELNIAKFLQKNKCQHYRKPYKTVIDGWNNECTEAVDLPEITNDKLHCHLTDYCTGISCCLEVPEINWNFEVYLLLDTCNFYMTVGIERLNFTFTLFDYEWGVKKKFDIGGIFLVEYSIEDLKEAKRFVVNMDLSVCLIQGQSCFTITVFKNMMVPKPLCDWEATNNLKDFSLTKFLEEQKLSLTAPLGDLAANILLEKMDLAQFLKDPPCSIQGHANNGWTSACPKNLNLPDLQKGIACSIPNHCTALDCCLDIPYIHKSINFKVDLNMCGYSLTVAIENIEFKMMIFKYKWGTPGSFNLKGKLFVNYIIDQLEAEKTFVVSVNVSVCLDPSMKCLINVPVLTDVLFPKIFCDWDSTISLKDFSLSTFMSDMKQQAGQKLSDLVKTKLAEKLGISAYIKRPQCQTGVGIHKATDGQWNKACPLDLSLPNLPSSVVCHVPSYCTGIDCCAEATSIGMAFNARVLLNACDFSLQVGIESLEYKKSLLGYNWGQWETFNLKGIVKIEFKIEDLKQSRKFLVSLNVQLCFDVTCLPKMTILTDAAFPKPFCNWDDELNLDGFSLEEFLKAKALAAGEEISGLVLSQMIDKIGIGQYFKDPMCDRKSAPYSGAVNNWKKDCSAAIELPTLPPQATCHLADPCGTIDCCVDVAILHRSINLKIGINFCDYSFIMKIENFGFHKALNFYKFGKWEKFTLKKFIIVDFMIADLFEEKKFVVSLNISLCLEKDSCIQTFPVLINAKMPKPICDWAGTADLKDFSLDTFLTDLKANTMETLTSSIADHLFEKLDIGKYLKNPQCSQTSSDYVPNIQGWKNDCPLPGIDSYLPALTGTTCHIGAICSEIECCIKTSYLPHAFSAMISVDMCNYILTLRLENMEHKEILLNYQWGQSGHFYIKGIVRIDYQIVDNKAEKKLKVTLSLSICLKENDCLFKKTLLDKVNIPKPFCDWKGMLAARTSSVTNWLKDKGLEIGDDLSSFGDTMRSQLQHELGISAYLVNTPCQHSDSPYSSVDKKNWKNDCTATTLPLIQLPKEARCHISDSCSALDCCVYVPVIKKTLHMTFNLDICRLTLDMSIESLKYTVSLLKYNWNTEDEFILGSLVRLGYKIEHKSSVQKLVLDINIKFCVGENCFINVPVFTQAEISYSPCSPSIPVPFRGVSIDFWTPTKCHKPTADNGCSLTLPGAVSEICSVTDNCMGIKCCIALDLEYLGFYSLSTGINIDYCNSQKLKLFIENKSWEKQLSTITLDEEETQKIGEAITVTYMMSKTSTLFKLSLRVKICINSGSDCIEKQLLDEVTFMIPNSCTRKRRRRRSSLVDRLVESTSDPRTLASQLEAVGATNEQIKQAFDMLAAIEADEVERRQTPQDGDMSKMKSAAKTMGNRNPGTMLYSGDISVVVKVEGAEKIKSMLGAGVKLAGRAHQAFVVGKGLTGAGMELLGAKLANMTLGELTALLDMKNVDPELALKLGKSIRDLMLALTSELIKGFLEGGDNMFKSFDLTLDGHFSFPRQSVHLFQPIKKIYPLGGFISLLFEFSASVSYGMDITVSAKIMSMAVNAVLRPYANIELMGSLGVGIFNLYGKLKLTGYIMEVAFPSTAEIGFSKFPLDVTLKVDLELIPLRLLLEAKVTIDLFFFGEKTLYETDLWRYETPKIRKNVIKLGKKEEDKSPPKVLNYVDDPIGEARCIVDQLPDRDYTEPAVEIAVRAEDDVSQVKLTVNVGTEPGLDNVLSGIKQGGPSSVMKQEFKPYGVKLFFTVIATNSGGGATTVTCSIPTYDITPPGGRLLQEFTTTSNPTVLKASVVVFDDSEIEFSAVGIGYGKGIYADETSRFSKIDLKKQRMDPYDASSDPTADKTMDYFVAPRSGRLNGPVIVRVKDIQHPGACLQKCLGFHGSKCLSINYDFGPSGVCELLESIDGHEHHIAQFGRYMHYERKGVGLAYELVHRDIHLKHNVMYYYNIHLVNVLHYTNIISSLGILVDLTSPTPGPLMNVSFDGLEVSSCLAMIPSDRPDWKSKCKGVSSSLKNNRTILDGPGSMTVFNGDVPLTNLLYTRSNEFVAANWDGFEDRESGLLGFTWTVGRRPCEELIHPHHDPHKHLFDQSEWTNIGLISPDRLMKTNHYPLPDGLYYITVRALNDVEYGGPLTTTICHTTPFAIDHTKPFVHEVYNVKYDEETFLVTAQYNATDPQSHIREVDICIGKTPNDCYIMEWKRLAHSETGVTYKFEIPGGTPAWVKIRAINHVDLMTVRSADSPIIIDITPPIPGIAYDGSVYKHDLDFTKDKTQICANWADFSDAESGIAFYTLQLVDSDDNILMELPEIPRDVHEQCMTLNDTMYLEHKETYFMEVWASNAGHKQLNSSTRSDGVLVDLTPPVTGEIIDGMVEDFHDIKFSLHRATVAAQWRGFSDPESDIKDFELKISRALDMSEDFKVIKNWVSLGSDSDKVEWHHFHLNHRDVVKTTVRATNGALNTVEKESSGFVVDLTAPYLVYLYDGGPPNADIQFQSSVSTLNCNFKFLDEESGLDHFKYQVFELFGGNKHQIYPALNDWVTIDDELSTTLTVPDLNLKPGAMYTVRVAAANKAGSLGIYITDGVVVDDTPPVLRWVHVGIFEGDEEEVHDGKIIQQDAHGIKATWFATDGQSGVKNYKVAVGTSEGGTDVLDWKDEGAERDRYINDLNLVDGQTYYVTVKAINGADMESAILTSKPVLKVKEDQAGLVVDGPDSTEQSNAGRVGVDIDYQKDFSTVTVQFEGFTSHEHGMRYFDWAVGTTAGGEEVQPFLMAGLVHNESEDNVPGNGIASTGFGQAVLPLEEGKKYYTSVRGITNVGTILQSSSDGFTVDTTPPQIKIESVSAQGMKTLVSGVSTIFQEEDDSLNAVWIATDKQSKVTSMSYAFGTFPYGTNIAQLEDIKYRLTGQASLPNGFKPVTEGKPNILTVVAENSVGLISRLFFPTVVVDRTPPIAGVLTCPTNIQPHSAVECSWDGFFDAESQIAKIKFQIGSRRGLHDILSPVLLDPHVSKYQATGLHEKLSHGSTYFATVTVINILDMSVASSSGPMTVDATPPVAGTVVELSSIYYVDMTDDVKTEMMNPFKCSTEKECASMDSVCHQSYTSISLAWQGFHDPETKIVKYQVAVGNTPGGGQIKPLFDVPFDKHYFTIKDILLKGQREVFVTVRAINGAGLSSMATSNGVFMSYLSQGEEPLSPVVVLDTDGGDIDVDFQTHTSRLTAKWDVTGDPCPVVKYEWAIERADGYIKQEFIDAEGRLAVVNDDIEMKNKEWYRVNLRVTNKEGYTYTIHSNGITIEDDPLKPGNVNDGDVIGFNLKFLPTKRKVTANWDSFGNDGVVVDDDEVLQADGSEKTGKNEKSTSQEIAYYELALGTDRRFPKTRDNVVPFTNVGLNKIWTFYDIDTLVPITATYYFTVRAYSTSGAMAQITSNGFSVGYDSGVIGGEIKMEKYVNSNEVLDIQWDGFTSEVSIMMYYVGVSTTTDPGKHPCRDFTESGRLLDKYMKTVFNVVSIRNVGKDTFAKIENLSLEQNSVYYAWIIGADDAGKCDMVKFMFQVDVTKPVEGRLRTGPYFDMKLTYASVNNKIDVTWENYKDDESGMKSFYVSLLRRQSCDEDAVEEVVVEPMTLSSDLSSYTFLLEFDLQPNYPYFVKLTAENHAKLTTTTISPPILYDNSKPTAGRVAKGHNFRSDIVWYSSVSTFTGSFLHLPTPVGEACPTNKMEFIDDGWNYLNSKNVYVMLDLNITMKLDLELDQKYVHAKKEKLKIKLTKSSGKHKMFSGAYYRHADMYEGGKYKIKIKAAKPVLDAERNLTDADQVVTSVIFWDGPTEYFLDLDYTPEDDLADESCTCCDNDPVDAKICLCDCVTRTRLKRSVNPSESKVIIKKLNDKNKHELESAGSITENKQIRHNSCGLQLYGGKMKRIVSWCGASESLQNPLVDEYPLNFDPADNFHEYTLNFFIRRDEAKVSAETWCFNIYIDNDLAIEKCGVPRLSISTQLIFTAWNYKNGIPHDIEDEEKFLKAWKANAVFKNLVMPPDSKFLCRTGEPFRGGNNAIISYEAGIGSSEGKDDISHFIKIKDMCVPCDRPCDRLVCQSECKHDTTELIKFQLDGLNLKITEVINEVIEPIPYFLTVKAVLGSGMSAVASSDKFNIDTTAPLIKTDSFMFLDVGQGQYTPTRFQKSKDTIKVVWKAEDDESDVVEHQWAIGTSVGAEDVQPFTSTGEKESGMNSALEGLLKNKHKYYVSIKCTNGAGMTSTYEDPDGVSALFEPPDALTVPSKLEEAEEIAPNIVPKNAMKSSDHNSVGASWEKSTDPDVQRYDFCVGSKVEFSEDIVPCVWVALNSAGNAKIKDGWLWVGGKKLRKLNNYRPGNTNDTETSKDAFNMPSGSVLYIHMKICNAANACSTKLVGSVTMTSATTTLTVSSDGDAINIEIRRTQGSRRRRAAAGISIDTPSGLQVGQSIAITELVKADLEGDYRSDASVDYVPYIINPTSSTNNSAFLDRILNRRLSYSDTDTSFSVTSVGDVPMPGPLVITFPYDPLDTVYVESLLYFDPGVMKWLQAKDSCQFESSVLTADPVTSLVTVKVCSTRKSNSTSRQRRATGETYFSEPTQFLLTPMLQAIPNDPPVLTSTTYVNMLEDAGTMLYQMTSFDADGDVIVYSLDPATKINHFGNLTVSVDGLFVFTPCSNCFGSEKVSVILSEEPVADIPPESVAVTITVEVFPTGDPPVVFVFAENSYILLPDKTVPVEVLVEQDRQGFSDDVKYEIFLGGYDFDPSDSLTILVSQPANGTVTIGDVINTVPPCAASSSSCYDLVLPKSATSLSWAHTIVSYQPGKDFYGFEEVRVYVQDDNGSLSDIATLSIAVMERPCQHESQCKSNNESAYTCNHANRARGFNNYYTCTCLPGWTGVDCSINIDECTSGPCQWPYMCFDEINGYYCACSSDNPNCDGLEPWMIALITVSVLLAVVVSFMAWYIFMVRQGRLKWSWLWDRMFRKSTSSPTKETKHAIFNDGFIQDEFYNVGSTLKQSPFMPKPSPAPPKTPPMGAPVSTSTWTVNQRPLSTGGSENSEINRPASVFPLTAVESEANNSFC